MTYVCYVIVCVNLLCSFDQAKSKSPSEFYQNWNDDLEILLSTITTENQYEYLAKLITPFWSLSYEDQLRKKQITSQVMVDFIVKRSRNLTNLMQYKMFPIVPSPVIKAYRNQDVFYISRGVDGNPKTVGCTFGKLTIGMMFSIRPTKLLTVRESHKRVAQVYEDFIRSSPIPACVMPSHDGHWNTLLVRSNEEGDVMVSVTVKPTGYTNETIQMGQQALKEYFFKHLPDISLYHQVCHYKKCTHDIAPFNLLYGTRYLTDTLCDYEFKITPDSVFPNNKYIVKEFFRTIVKAAELKHNSTLLDICCGTGTNTIILSKFVRRVIGFDSVMGAIKEAENDAFYNDVKNVRFQFGRIQSRLRMMLSTVHPSSYVVAILNHRRIGIDMDTIRTIRMAPKISRLVLLFFRPNSRYSIQNFVELCSENNSTVPAFKLTKVIPFDILPLSTHVEVVLILERKKVGNM